MKNDNDTYSESGLFFNPEVDVVGCDLVLKATSEGDEDFAYTINFKDKSGNLMFTKVVPLEENVEFTDEEKAKLKTGVGSDIFFGENWKVANTTDDTKSEFNISTKLTKDTFAVDNINEVDLQISEFEVQEDFKCFAECSWDEIVNVIHGKTRSGRNTPWANADFPTGYARLLFDNANLPQLESSNREGGTNMAGGQNVTTPHNCFTSGCQKLVHIGKAGTESAADDDDYFVNMIGFDHDVISSTIQGNTANKAPLTLQMVGALKTGHRNSSAAASTNQGWYTANNELRLTLNNIANGYIPTATDGSNSFKVAMCKKGSASKTAENTCAVGTSDDYLWVPDPYEVAGINAALGKTTTGASYANVWYDNSQELNPNATHAYENTTPTNRYFLRVAGNDNAHAPWYSVAWDRANRTYGVKPRGVFEGDRADFTGFIGNLAVSGTAYGSSTGGFMLSSNATFVNTMGVGTSQYEYWARFQTETPVGVTNGTPRYKGDRTVGKEEGLYTSKKPSMNKYVHFKKEGGTVAVSDTNSSVVWISRTARPSSYDSNCYFGKDYNFKIVCDGNDKYNNYKVPTSLVFALE